VCRDRAEIRGFGSFTVKEIEHRIGRNPKNRQKTPAQEKLKTVLRTGKELKSRVNEGY
jgi:integration host factor subunit beta